MLVSLIKADDIVDFENKQISLTEIKTIGNDWKSRKIMEDLVHSNAISYRRLQAWKTSLSITTVVPWTIT